MAERVVIPVIVFQRISKIHPLWGYRYYHGELHIIEIWTSLPGRFEHRLLFDWPTVHPSNRSFVTIIIDSCPIFWKIFFLSSRKIIIKGIRIPIKRFLSVSSSTVERISIFKNRQNIRIISKHVVLVQCIK